MLKSTLGALLVACVALVTLVAPVAASGRVGAHSLTDTASKPGATVNYKFHPVGPHNNEDHWQLHRIVVRPPNMKAVAGKSYQTVGWSFLIQRIECFEPPCFWTDRYTSPVFTAVTSDAANAAFAKESVSVHVPTNAGLYHYRAFVNMYWYKPDGSVQGTVTTRVNFYKWSNPDHGTTFEGACPGGVY